MNKYELFLRSAKLLNEKFNIEPLLYGSLGLEVLTSEYLNSDDIDVLIPEEYLSGDKWNSFKTFLESYDYKLIDLHEHTFITNDIKIAFASIENLEPFAGIKIDDINIYDNNCKYRLLTLEQYLKVYEKSSLDGYRLNKKEKQDNKKIEFIKSKLK